MDRTMTNRIMLVCGAFLALIVLFIFQYNTTGAVTDTTPPTSQATINASRFGPSTFNISSSINGVASDTSGLLQVALKIVRSGDNKFLNGSSWVSGESQLATNLSGSGSVTWTFNGSNFLGSGLQDGTTYTVTPRATDLAGNTADGSSDSFIWDESNPAVNITNPSNGSTVNTSFNLNANSSENVTCQYKQDSGAFATFTSVLSTSHTKSLSGMSTGAHTIQVRCTDEAGNISSTATSAFTVSTNANTNTNTNSSSGGSGNSNTNAAVPNQPVVTVIAPASQLGIKARNERITCRATDNNNVNRGFDTTKTKMTINGTNVNAAITNINSNSVVTNTNTNGNNNNNGNANGNTNTNNSNGSNLRIIELSYAPDSSHLYEAGSTLDIECDVWNNNNFRSIKSFQLSIGNDLSSNSNTNASNTNTNASNTNSSTVNQNTNAPATGSGSTFFKDTSSHWSKDYVEKLHTTCAVEGFKDAAGNLTHEFGPDKPITRAELIAMVLKCRKFDPASMTSTDIPFSDVSASHWALKYILEGKNDGIIGGYPDGTFGADRSILRVEALKVILLGWLHPLDITGGNATFKDLVSGAWYIKYVNYAVLKGYVSGYKNADGTDSGEFRPGNNITRGEAAKIITNVMEKK